MLSFRIHPEVAKHTVQVAGLLVVGVAFSAAFSAVEAQLPRSIYFEPSYTLSLVAHAPLAFLLALISIAFSCWLYLPAGRGRFTWRQIDDAGGLRWPIFVVVATLAWSYSGHGYNYIFDQSHVWDRLLLVLLMLEP